MPLSNTHESGNSSSIFLKDRAWTCRRIDKETDIIKTFSKIQNVF